MKILVGAQFWAYGPASKASAIAHELKKRGASLDFVGSDTSFDFCKNTENFNQLFRISSPSDYLDLNISKYDAVISVMDPYLAFYAKKMHKQIFYVDSMSWFWIWKNKKNIFSKFDSLQTCTTASGLSKIEKMIPDDRQLTAHLCADRIFSQGIPQCISETEKKAVNAGSAIDLSYRKRVVRDTVLVSLSGGISPATNLKSAVNYSKMVIDILEGDIYKINEATRFVITGHPEVINKIRKEDSIFEFKSLNHKEFLTELNRSIVTVVPCGFTTVFESLAYGTPVMFLPDNHNGHAYEFQIISNSLKTNRNKVFPNMLFPLGKSSLDNIRTIEESMKRIKAFTSLYSKDRKFRQEYNLKWRNMIGAFNKDDDILAKQVAAISYFIPTFSGAKFISDEIVKKVSQDRKHSN